MTRINETWLLMAAVTVVTVIAAAITIAQPSEDYPTLSDRSTNADGALAFRLWLEQTGYSTHEILSNPIQLGDEDALFILAPLMSYSNQEAKTIYSWVTQGHTLIVAAYPYTVDELLRPYQVTLHLLSTKANDLQSQTAPIMASPPFDKAKVEPIASITTQRTDVTVYISSGTDPILVSFPEGSGTVWILGALQPFTNLGLSDPGDARLVTNMLTRLPQGATIAFDEARHGIGEIPSVSAWLFDTLPGWGLLIALVLTMTFLGLRGRRFGRAVPLPDDRLRREPVEYIRAIANLFRRSGQRAEIVRHYRRQLRRRLHERYSVDTNLTDVEMVKIIAFRDPTIDEAALRTLLADLARPSVTEPELVKLAAAVDGWLRERLARHPTGPHA
jgi:hypothetical protein